MEDVEELLIKEISKTLGTEFKKALEDGKRLNDERYERSVERMTAISTKLDEVLRRLSER